MRLPLGLLITCFMSGAAETVDMYKKGGVAVLSPGTVPGPITSVTWKHGADIAVEWYGEQLDAYRDFRGRCEVNLTTGALMISNLSLKDSGSYTAEINNRVMETTEIKVITAVPKPTISTHCNPEETQCTLTCNANIPETAGSVTYSWMMGDVVKPATKQLDITKDDTESVGKLISCQLKNPVSSERSDDIMSPFTNGPSVAVIAAAVVTSLIVLVIVLGLLVHCRIWCNHRAEGKNAGCRQNVAWFKRRSWLNCGGGPEYTLAQEQRNGVETAAQDLTPVELPETTSDPETTSEVQEELEGDQTPPGSADTSKGAGMSLLLGGTHKKPDRSVNTRSKA
ncbi:CD48 antigen-like isoform X2 [Archocentrus centrarchus]|uniref:CD48 antigen-like isoform X2 n=1 Tax=Archocentrus centrarchus TaxID=63155 RepID=UPI0011EA1A9F|nr:CD48 antigen-like isoform X2 [Archocentrus centrarchus]